MSDTVQTIAQTAFQTAAALAPTLAAADPRVAAVVALAPIALQFLQAATTAQQVGLMSPEQLVGMFAIVNQGVQSSHTAWQQMNSADAARQA